MGFKTTLGRKPREHALPQKHADEPDAPLTGTVLWTADSPLMMGKKRGQVGASPPPRVHAVRDKTTLCNSPFRGVSPPHRVLGIVGFSAFRPEYGTPDGIARAVVGRVTCPWCLAKEPLASLAALASEAPEAPALLLPAFAVASLVAVADAEAVEAEAA